MMFVLKAWAAYLLGAILLSLIGALGYAVFLIYAFWWYPRHPKKPDREVFKSLDITK